jgi:DNA-binding SARP family transcriptional activator
MSVDLRRRGARGSSPGPDEPAGPRFRLSLLRGFELREHGSLVTLQMSAQRLVAFLALRDRAVLRSMAAGVLWPEATEDRAGANLRSTIWRLHRPAARSTSPIEVTTTHVRLLSSVAVDIHSMVAVAERLLDPSMPLEAPDFARMSLMDDLLPDWYEDWVSVERERLRQLRLHALEALCDRLMLAGSLGAAVDAGLAAVAAEPLRESAHRTLIRVFLAEGNHADAIRQYLSYRRLLQDELNLAPSRQLEELMRQSQAG